jgi:hypothetical protein
MDEIQYKSEIVEIDNKIKNLRDEKHMVSKSQRLSRKKIKQISRECNRKIQNLILIKQKLKIDEFSDSVKRIAVNTIDGVLIERIPIKELEKSDGFKRFRTKQGIFCEILEAEFRDGSVVEQSIKIKRMSCK